MNIRIGDYVITNAKQIGRVIEGDSMNAKIELFDDYDGFLSPTNVFSTFAKNELTLYQGGSATDELSEEERKLWNRTYQSVLSQTHDELKAALAANGSIERERTLVGYKSIVVNENSEDGATVYGWGLLFTDAKAKDLQDTYFNQLTLLLTDYYKNAPLWYEHGADNEYGQMPVGKRSKIEVYPRGIWVEHQLNPNHPQYSRTIDELRKGELSYSSDSIAHFVEEGWDEKDGYLSIWPLAGWSLVKRPAEPGLGPVRLKTFVDAVKSVSSVKDKSKKIVDPVLTKIGKQLVDSLNRKELEQLKQMLMFNADRSLKGLTISPKFLDELGWSKKYETHSFLFTLYDIINKHIKESIEDKGMYRSRKSNVATEERKSRFSRKTNIPYTVRDEDKQDRVREYKTININRGSRKPGLADIIYGHIKNDSRQIQRATKSMSFSDNVSGGYIVNREIAADILNPLYATEVVIAAGAEVVPMDGIETLTVRKMTSGVDAYWAGEAQAGSDSNPTFGVVSLNLRELVARVRIPNRLLNNTTDLEARVREDIVKRMRLKMDQSFLFGTGSKTGSNSGSEPLGVVNWPNVTATSLGTNGNRPKLTDLTQAIQRIEVANIEPSDTWSFVMHPRTKTTFTEMTDTTGAPLLRSEGWKGGPDQTLAGYKYFTTTQVPITETVGTNSDNSYVILGDWKYAVVGMGMDVEITVDTSRYVNERETLIQAVAMVDFGVYYPQAFQVLSGVRA